MLHINCIIIQHIIEHIFSEADAKAHGNLLIKEKQHTNLYT